MAGMISGLPEAPLKNITLKNIAISSVLGMQSRYANGTLHNVKITSVTALLGRFFLLGDWRTFFRILILGRPQDFWMIFGVLLLCI